MEAVLIYYQIKCVHPCHGAFNWNPPNCLAEASKGTLGTKLVCELTSKMVTGWSGYWVYLRGKRGHQGPSHQGNGGQPNWVTFNANPARSTLFWAVQFSACTLSASPTIGLRAWNNKFGVEEMFDRDKRGYVGQIDCVDWERKIKNPEDHTKIPAEIACT